MDFEKTCMLFSMQEPYYGIILSSMERIPTTRIKTIGVGRCGNVFRLFYNPDYMATKDLETTLLIIKHELLHLAFNHFTIWGDPEGYRPPEDERELRNIACDLEVNSYLDTSKMHDVGPLVPEDHGWDRYEGTLEYYKRLKKEMEDQVQAAINPSMPCNGGQEGEEGEETDDSDTQTQDGGGQNPLNGKEQDNQEGQSGQPQQSNGGNPTQSDGQPQPGNQQGQPMNGQQKAEKAKEEFFKNNELLDDHSEWPSDMTSSEMENIQQVIDDMLVFAADEVEKNRGCVPGELAGRIEKLRKKPKPVTDWKRYFRRYLGNEFTELIRKSKKRESHRFPDAAGNRHQRKSHILVAIDTSGSVSMPEYMEFMGQIKTLEARATFHVVECDARIQYEYDYKNRPNKTLHGGGGTDFQPPIDIFNKNKRKYDALVYLTDGYAPIPKDTPKETLWVISSSGDHDKKKYKVNGASAVFIKQQQ